MGVIDLQKPSPKKPSSQQLNNTSPPQEPTAVRPTAADMHRAAINPPAPTEAIPAIVQGTKAVSTGSGLRKWATLFVLSLALAIIIIDTTLLNVSLRTIIHDLNTNIQGLQWVITSYALVLAAFTITGGRLGDLFGRKRMFVTGAIIFASGSLLASVSQRLGVLVAGESIIEGIGAALMMPATASLLVANFKGRERAIAFGVWGSVAGAASAIGPILGGYLTSHYSWRWGFRINVVVAAVLVIGSVLIKESRDQAEKPQLDVVGVLLSALGLLTVVFGIIQSSTYGWFAAKQPYAIFGHTLSNTISITPMAVTFGLIMLMLFGAWEKLREDKGRTPLVSLSIFNIKQFTTGAFTMALMSLSMVGMIFVLPVYLQSVKGLDAYHTGLTLLPMSLSLLVVGPLAGFISRWIRPKLLIQLGLATNILAVLVLRQALSVDAPASALYPALALNGIGFGLIMAQISNLTLSAVSVQQAGEASGVNNTLRQVGSSLGSAILGAVLLTAITTNVSSGILASNTIPPNIKPQLAQTVGANAQNAAFGGAGADTSKLPQAVSNEIQRVVKQSSTDATRTTVLYGIPFSILALLVSTQLTGKRNLETEQSAAQAGH